MSFPKLGTISVSSVNCVELCMKVFQYYKLPKKETKHISKALITMLRKSLHRILKRFMRIWEDVVVGCRHKTLRKKWKFMSINMKRS
jgi:hypothetical protein